MIELIRVGNENVLKLQRCKYCGSSYTMDLEEIRRCVSFDFTKPIMHACPVCKIPHQVDFTENYYGGTYDVD